MTAISYDASEHPTKWKNASNPYRLTEITFSNVMSNIAYNALCMKCDANGIHTSKQYVEHVTDASSYIVTYTTDGTKILSEQRTGTNTHTIYCVYDANGMPVRMKCNGVEYWYDKNLQGDITAIRNASGTLVAQYEYDAWGKHIRITDGSGNDVSDNPNHIANINPFRYRGYYFDVETGWYYLNARYYDPNVGRFISPDAILGANGGLQGYNLFAYCNNNPVMYIDPNGMCMRGVYNDFPFICHDYSENGVCVYCGKRWTNDYIRALFDEEGLPAYVDPVLRSRYLALNSCAVQRQEAIAKIKRRAATEPIKKVYEEEMAAVLCFVAGTEIKTEQGDKPIEEIRVGDYVWAYSPETDETMLKRVTNTFVNKTDRLMRIIVNGEEIMATPEHPFYIPYCTDSRSADWGLGSGWIKAKDLRAGDVLYLLDGSTAVIEYIELVLLTCPVSVFNFEVEDFHSYFVGNLGFLAHNTCLPSTAGGSAAWKQYDANDKFHSFPSIVDNYASYYGPYNGMAEYRAYGSYAGYDGYFQWYVSNGNAVHRQFNIG